jgi:hypothetical protein
MMGRKISIMNLPPAKAKKEFSRYLPKLGTILRVVVKNLASGHLMVDATVVGERASLYLNGASLGYTGGGSCGLRWLLNQVGAKYKVAQISAGQTEDEREFIVP